ncbi:MAG: metal ABC transporter permease [Bacilli bacterium]|nr:metal ABC transporter permease [Bacilli bacterium]
MIFLVDTLGDFFRALVETKMIQYGLIAGILIGILAPMIGSVVVIRRLSFIADTLSHFSLAGVTLGVFLSKFLQDSLLADIFSPLGLGIIFSILGTFLIEIMRNFYKNYKELSMPVIMSAGVAISGIFIALSAGNASNVTTSYLFGSIYAVTLGDLITILFVSALIVLFSIFFYHPIITLCFDETYARISGINVRMLQLGITVILALFISVFMEIIGVLLISALMIVPVATSILIGRSFKSSTFLAIIFSELSILLGFIVSYCFGLPTGSVIVLLNIVILILVLIFKPNNKSKKIIK